EVFHFGGDEVGEVPSLSAALRRGGIARATGELPHVAAAQVEALDLPAEIDREELRQLLQARGPASHSVMQGGIVVPHPRYPIVLPIDAPMLRLCFLDGPSAGKQSQPAVQA